MNQKITGDLHFLVGNAEVLENMQMQCCLVPFSDEAFEFLSALSSALLKDERAKSASDVITFAFWCRRASLYALKAGYKDLDGRLGRGCSLHIAPSNVPINFAFSLASSLLAGNSNIVRVSSKDFEQVDIVCDAINKILRNDARISPYICVVRYEHNREITDYLSSMCDSRIIWGGNETINLIRKSPIKPRAIDLTFADRHSICVIDSDYYLEFEDKQKIAQDFYNDTYLSDQNACTSPCLIVWIGGNMTARDIFWKTIFETVRQKYTISQVTAVDKLVNLCKISSRYKCKSIGEGENVLFRIELESLFEELTEYRGNCGYFYEYKAKTLDEILPVCGENCQTLSYIAKDDEMFIKFTQESRPRGIDRIVPVGRTMDFSLNWDGYDLIYSLSRKIAYSKF